VGILLLGAIVAGFWWWTASSTLDDWRRRHEEADRELVRLEEVRKKGDEYKRKKDELARKIDLITTLKKQQAVPVHILDQISKNLPEFLWLENMSVTNNQIALGGKATTYNAVTNFYNNLRDSGFFATVELGRTFEVQEGVAFSINCAFSGLEPQS
jgi:Tfp pilus assembly protein PilN